MANDWPRCEMILRHYQVVRSALDELARIAAKEPDRFPLYRFRTNAEIIADVSRQRQELDQHIVLMLTASFEAAFQTDFRHRVERRFRDDVSRQLRNLEKRTRRRRPPRNRVTLDELLEIWKDTTGVTQAIGGLKQLLLYRHWLAHGRYWNQKSGLSYVDPLEATQRGRRIMEALRNHSELFAAIADELVPQIDASMSP